MIAALVGFLLIPFTCFMEIDQILMVTLNEEIIIDVIWIWHIFICFCLAKETDDGLEERWTVIAKSYLTSDFIFDLIPSFTIVFIGNFPEFYLFLILRMKQLGTMRNYLKQFWWNLGMIFEFSK
jgi:hypothetical protein